jgi:hypothetical protein
LLGLQSDADCKPTWQIGVSLSKEDFHQWSFPLVNTSAEPYERHRSETTLLYQIIQEHWPRFHVELGKQGKHLPKFVTQEFDEYLKCGRLEHGFLRVVVNRATTRS